MAVSAPGALPLTRDLTLVFRLTQAVGMLLVATSAAGLLYGPRGWFYGTDALIVPALLGQDLLTLVAGLPLLAVSALLARRGSLRGLLCWMGALFYFAYSYYFYVIGAPFNVYFPLYIGVVSMSMYGALALFFSLDLPRVASRIRGLPAGAISLFFMVTALWFAGLWLSIVDRHLTAGTSLDGVSRAVIAVDGVVLLPLLLFAGRALGRRDPLGYALAGLLLVKTSATFLTLVASTAIATRWGQRPDPLQTAAYGAGFLLASGLLVRYLKSVGEAPAATSAPLKRAA
jgi:hypothetical protein